MLTLKSDCNGHENTTNFTTQFDGYENTTNLTTQFSSDGYENTTNLTTQFSPDGYENTTNLTTQFSSDDDQSNLTKSSVQLRKSGCRMREYGAEALSSMDMNYKKKHARIGNISEAGSKWESSKTNSSNETLQSSRKKESYNVKFTCHDIDDISSDDFSLSSRNAITRKFVMLSEESSDDSNMVKSSTVEKQSEYDKTSSPKEIPSPAASWLSSISLVSCIYFQP